MYGSLRVDRAFSSVLPLVVCPGDVSRRLHILEIADYGVGST